MAIFDKVLQQLQAAAVNENELLILIREKISPKSFLLRKCNDTNQICLATPSIKYI